MWTRSKRRRRQTNIPSVSQGEYRQAVSTKGTELFGLVLHQASVRTKCWPQGPLDTGQKKRNYGSCVKKTRGSRKKNENRRCSSRTLVKKGASQERGRWRWMRMSTARKSSIAERKSCKKKLQETSMNVRTCRGQCRMFLRKRGNRNCKK